MDHQPNAWNNSFVLSELAQSTLGSDADMESLTVRVLEGEESTQPQSSIKNLGSLVLETTFSWQVQNITCSRTSITHAKVFTFLLQTYRARRLLQPHVLDLKHFGSGAGETTSAVQLAIRLRQRLISLIDILHAYTASTTHMLHDSLRKELTAAPDIDAMAAVWTTHIKHIVTALLLAQNFSSIREAITTCLELCEQLAPLWIRLVNSDILAKSIGEDGVKPNPPAASDFISMRTEFDNSLSFILAGVRTIGRASGSKMLEELAERLEWMVQ
jgi:gamma-tubulin complex component 5